MTTKLYFHNTASTDPGSLPTATQSGLTENAHVDAQTVNRTMTKTIGTSQTSKALTSNATVSTQNYYFTKFISPRINQTSIAANTWTFQFAAQESNANANYPVTTSAVMRIVAYVWDCVANTKKGDILNGNSASSYSEAGTGETALTGTFTGAAVNSLTAGNCVIVFEVWAITTQGNATSRTDTFFYDGTTEASTTTNAAFLSTPENIVFTVDTQPSDSLSLIEIITKAVNKAISDTITSTDNVTTLKTKTQSVSDTLTLNDTLTKAINKSVSDSTTLTDLTSKSIVKKLSDSPLFTDSVVKNVNKAVSDSISIVESITKKIVKNLSDQITITESTNKSSTKLLNDFPSITDSLNKTISKFITDNVTLLDIMNKGINKSIFDVITLTDNAVEVKTTGSVNIAQAIADDLTTTELIVVSIPPNISQGGVTTDKVGVFHSIFSGYDKKPFKEKYIIPIIFHKLYNVKKHGRILLHSNISHKMIIKGKLINKTSNQHINKISIGINTNNSIITNLIISSIVSQVQKLPTYLGKDVKVNHTLRKVNMLNNVTINRKNNIIIKSNISHSSKKSIQKQTYNNTLNDIELIELLEELK